MIHGTRLLNISTIIIKKKVKPAFFLEKHCAWNLWELLLLYTRDNKNALIGSDNGHVIITIYIFHWEICWIFLHAITYSVLPVKYVQLLSFLFALNVTIVLQRFFLQRNLSSLWTWGFHLIIFLLHIFYVYLGYERCRLCYPSYWSVLWTFHSTISYYIATSQDNN